MESTDFEDRIGGKGRYTKRLLSSLFSSVISTSIFKIKSVSQNVH